MKSTFTVRTTARAILLTVAATFATAAGAAAQSDIRTSGTLRVAVVDQTDAALVAARVSVVDTNGVDRTVAVDGRGIAVFERLVPAIYTVTGAAEGFRALTMPVTVRPGDNRATLRLVVATTDAVVVREQDAAARRDNGFTRRLTQEEIDALPDDPDEMADALARMAGPGAHIFVNSFRNGRLPPKDQILQIRFYSNSYSAEYHDVGIVRVEITTKPGAAGWRGQVNFGFRDESLTARNAFTPEKGREQLRRYVASFTGPIAKGRTGFSLSFDGNTAYESRSVVAQTPGGTVNAAAVSPADALNVTARLEHLVGSTGQVLVEYSRRQNSRSNLGVGDFDLPERAYAVDSDGDMFRLRAMNSIGQSGFSEVRFQLNRSTSATRSASTRPTMRVNGFFTEGGAGQQGERRAQELELAQNIDLAIGQRHSLRAGALLEAGWWENTQRSNAAGTYTFTSLDAYLTGKPALYTIRTGDPSVTYSQVKFGWYVQDDIRPSRTLQLSVGLRQEAQTHVASTWKPAPRTAFTWSVSRTATVRGGYGIFYDWYDAGLYEQTITVDGSRQIDIIIANPPYPVNDPGGAAVAPSVIRSGTLEQPGIHQASIGVERTLTSWAEIRADYMSNRGFDTLRSINTNAPMDGVRPNAELGNVTEIQSSGKWSLDRLTLALSMRQPTRRVVGMVMYQLGSRRNLADTPLSLPSDSLNPDLDWGPAAEDVRHRLFVNLTAPVGAGIRLGLNSQGSSARPYTVTTGFDTNGDTVFNERAAGVSRNSARGAAQWTTSLRVTKSFGLGASGARPTLAPRIERSAPNASDRRALFQRSAGDGAQMGVPSADPGRYRLDLYVNVQNLFNNVNYNDFVGNVLSAFFGRATSAGPSRRVEIGGSLGF